MSCAPEPGRITRITQVERLKLILQRMRALGVTHPGQPRDAGRDRHTYAQRHADAGMAPDVLRELMNHQVLDTAKLYYRVGEKRRRAVGEVSVLAAASRELMARLNRRN